MKIALAQLDYHIGNFLDNTTNIVLEIKKAQQNEVDLIVFSELSVCGYPPLDLLERKEFVLKCESEVKRIARICTDIGVIIGGPSINPEEKGKLLYNSAYFLFEGDSHQQNEKSMYNSQLTDEEKASNCIDCGECEKQCPQNLPIRKELKKVKTLFED